MPKLNAQVHNAKIGIFDIFCDVGNVKTPGKASYSVPDQTYRISGSGANIWFGKDDFAYLAKSMNGDFIFQTQVTFIGEGHEPHRKGGIMLRSSENADSLFVSCQVHGDGLTSFQYRKAVGADVEEVKFAVSGPNVLQLERKGDSYIMSVAKYGSTYVSDTLSGIALGEDILAGLFVCAHNNEYNKTIEYNNTRVFKPAWEGLQQYKDYLGSSLQIVDVETGNCEVLANFEKGFEAPNWSVDGKTLILNSGGLLYNFNIETRTYKQIETDFAIRNNNDHVLSFDGKQMGISHHTKELNGKSLIYTIPVEGGTPKKVTDKGPSYLHGWSPDGKNLIYTAERDGVYNLFRIPVEGGKETQLTDTKGLDDGSEYSADGKYIYFNSTRTGTMQIWRMDADGKNQVQLTFDELNDWFPHVSPDNKWIVFVSYPKEVPADEHPYYERVYLRMIPVDGGEPKVLSYLYGGQGTINVPSWSPDSKKVAFISNGN